MTATPLTLTVRTPREIAWETTVSSLRVPTETGQVGIRPGIEPLVLAVESGLVVVRRGRTLDFVGTAGGLLRCDGHVALLLTPLAVTGADESAVMDALQVALRRPSTEMEARALLGRLQSTILLELRQRSQASVAPVEVRR